MNLIKSYHNFSHTGDYCAELSILYKHITIDDTPIEVILSVHHDKTRFIVDSCGKLYMLLYRKVNHLVPDTAILLYDAAVTGICIKKILYNGYLFLILDEDGNLYGEKYFHVQKNELELFKTDVVDIVTIGGSYFTVDVNYNITCEESENMFYVEKYGLNSSSKFYLLDDDFYYIDDDKFCFQNDVICDNVKCVEVCDVPSGFMAMPSSHLFICVDTNNLITYGNCRKQASGGKESIHIQINDDVHDVFIIYHSGDYDINLSLCYVTSNGIFEISAHNQSKLLTENVNSYIKNVNCVTSLQIKSAAKI